MKTPSRSPIMAAATAFLISTGVFAKPSPKAEDRPVPPVPSDVMKKGGDAVLDWMLDGGYLTPEYLRQVTGEKVHAATQEGADKNPLLMQLRSGYESLSVMAFKAGVKPIWETVAAKLTPDVLAKVNKLESPRIYGVNGNGELLIGDGGKDVPSCTLRQNYFKARSGAQAAGLALMTRKEYRSFNDGSMEDKTWTWLEAGDAPAFAFVGDWLGRVGVSLGNPGRSDSKLGARRVLRVSLR